MTAFSVGDKIRIDIPDETDPDHDQYHSEHGRIIEVITDEITTVTGQQIDETRYRIRLPDGEELELPAHAIRPPFL